MLSNTEGSVFIMKFTFTEKRMDSSEDLRAYAVRKVGKLDRFFETEGEAFITFSIERGRFLAEITIRNNGLFYRASELTNDMYASVDSGVAAIERQIRRNKTRLEKRLREGALEHEEAPSFVPAEEEADEEIQVLIQDFGGTGDRAQQALLHQTHVSRGGYSADEPAGARVLRVQEHGGGRCYFSSI